jgi:inosine-uridine nucleoside N-ribohydrolase
MTTPVIIDTDPGIDDALALVLAFASPEVEVLGVTTVGGNSGIAHTTENALRLLHLLGADDVPVAAGAETPLVHADSYADPSTHGEDGFGGVVLDPAPRGADERSAVELMVDLIEGSDRPVTLVAIGPLTNLAVLDAAHPRTFRKLERIVIMGGGARTLGNMTPAAEFNIWFDPEAAARVFRSGVPVTMVGLDVTHQAVTPQSAWEPLRGKGRVADAVTRMVDFYTAFHEETYGTSDTAQHDSLAVGAVIDPTLLQLRDCHVDVECAGRLTRGMTVADLDGVGDGRANARVALEVDTDRFNDLLVSRIAALDERLG